MDVRSPLTNMHGQRGGIELRLSRNLGQERAGRRHEGLGQDPRQRPQNTRSFPSGPKLTPKEMVSGVKRLAPDWTYNAVSMAILVRFSRPADCRAIQLRPGWVGFDFGEASLVR